MSTQTTVAPAADNAAPAATPAVVFDRVSFAFDDHQVLRDVSFTVPTRAGRF